MFCQNKGYTLGSVLSSPRLPKGGETEVDVTYFHRQRSGPESIIENAVADQIPNLFANEASALWMARSPSIGAGMPDLVVVSHDPRVLTLAQFEIPTAQILAYLRAVGCARLDTIIERVGMPEKYTVRCLNDLVRVEAVLKIQDKYELPPLWRHILTEIITIEVKVKNWKRAVEQAARNSIFAHRSFMALPDRLAQRVKSESILKKLGIGLISVGDDRRVKVLRRSRRRIPRVWKYYYEVAFLVASHSQ